MSADQQQADREWRDYLRMKRGLPPLPTPRIYIPIPVPENRMTNAVNAPLPSKEDNYEIQPVTMEVERRGWTWMYIQQPDLDVLEIRGPGAQAFAGDAKQIGKHAAIQGNMGPDGLRMLWQKGVASMRRPPSLHPIGPEMDDAALAVLPARITTHDHLTQVCRQLDNAIEAAYPKILLGTRGWSKGKLNLVLRLQVELWRRTDKMLTRAPAIIMLGLMKHLQAGENYNHETAEIPELPPAFAE